MFAVTVHFRLKPENMTRFMPLMLANAAKSLQVEPGCRQFDVCSDMDRPGDVFLYEVYDSQAAFLEHLESAHFLSFDAAVRDMIEEKSVSTFREVRQ